MKIDLFIAGQTTFKLGNEEERLKTFFILLQFILDSSQTLSNS